MVVHFFRKKCKSTISLFGLQTKNLSCRHFALFLPFFLLRKRDRQGKKKGKGPIFYYGEKRPSQKNFVKQKTEKNKLQNVYSLYFRFKEKTSGK
jgi:hypothetical protein